MGHSSYPTKTAEERLNEARVLRMLAEKELENEEFTARVQTEKARILQQRRPWYKKLLNLRISITTTGE